MTDQTPKPVSDSMLEKARKFTGDPILLAVIARMDENNELHRTEIAAFAKEQPKLNLTNIMLRTEIARLEQIIYAHSCEYSLKDDDWELSGEARAIEPRRAKEKS